MYTNGKHMKVIYMFFPSYFSFFFFSSTLYFESHSGSCAGLSGGQEGCTDEGGCRVEEAEVAEAVTHLFPAGLRPRRVTR